MKKILLAGITLASIIGAGAASAADLPRRTAPVAPMMPVAVPVFTWTGFYAGVNAGYGWTDQSSSTFVPGIGTVSLDRSGDGFVGGGQIGYNYQIGQFVVGVETDIQYAGLDKGNRTIVGFPGGFVPAYRGGIDWFGTARARAGFAIDRALVYGTGGFAYGGGGETNNCPTLAFGCRSDDDVRTGYTLGGGVEYAITNNLTAKLEGLYVNLDRKSSDTVGFTAAGAPVVVNGSRANDFEFGVVRAGLNYKF